MLEDATPLDLVVIPTIRVDYHGPYLNRLYPAPPGDHPKVHFVDSCAMPTVMLDGDTVHVLDERVWDARVSRIAPPEYPDRLFDATERETTHRTRRRAAR